MATVGEAEVLVHATLDMKAIQQFGWAARAVELAQQECETVETAFNTYIAERDVYEGMDERGALLHLAACCLARLWEIR